MKFDETKLRKYLLDDLSSADTEEIELQILDHSDPETSLAIAEHELFEDFIDGNLTVSERELFQKNFLVSQRRQDELEFLRSLRKQTAKAVQIEKKPENPTPSITNWRNFFGFKPFQFAAASFALLILTAGIWWLAFANQETELAKEFSALNKKDLKDLSGLKDFPTLALIPGIFRGNESMQSITKNDSGEPILLRLALQGNYSAKPEISLYRGEELISTLKEAAVYQNPAGSEVRLLLPSARLEKGDYRVELLFGTEKSVYNFTLK